MSFGFAVGVGEVPEELRVRLQYQHITLVVERFAVCLKAAIEGIEFRVLVVLIRIDFGGLAIADAANFLRRLVRFGNQHRALAFRFGADLLRLLRSGRT